VSSTGDGTTPPQPATTGDEPLTLVAVGLVMLTVVLWAGTPVAIRFSTDLLPPFSVSGIRFALAAVFMLGWTFAHGTSVKLKRENLGPPMIAGFLMFLQIGTFTLGVHMSNASHGSIFINTFIFWVVGIEHFVTKEKSLSIRNSVGLILAAAGVLLILKSAEKPPGVVVEEAASIEGDLLLLLSALLLGIKISWTKHSLKTIHPDCFIFWHHVFGVILFAIYGAFVEKSDPRILTELSREDVRAAWWGLLYQGLAVAGLCFAIQARLLKKHSASRISVFSFATPLFGILFAVLLRGDPLSPWLFLAGVAVAAGILLVNLEERKPAS
jgi:drug/metabolite transporter (DMT)-like permease